MHPVVVMNVRLVLPPSGRIVVVPPSLDHLAVREEVRLQRHPAEIVGTIVETDVYSSLVVPIHLLETEKIEEYLYLDDP